MKIAVVLILTCVVVALSAPSPDRQEQKPATVNYNNPFNQIPANNGQWMFSGSGLLPGFGGVASKQSGFPFPAGFDTMAKMDGVETITASSGMSCSYQNGKKQCTKN